MARLVLFNKPFGVLCQFTDRTPLSSDVRRSSSASVERPAREVTATRPTLADYIEHRDVYPAGRLDFDSEGLVVLTNDGALQARIADPRHKMLKRYVAQVSGVPSSAALAELCLGVLLRDGPAKAQSAARTQPMTWSRTPPVQHPHSTSWVVIELSEGRNRQVRRMLAAVGHPVLRLIRTHVGPWSVDALAPGACSETLLHVPTAPDHRASGVRDSAARTQPPQKQERSKVDRPTLRTRDGRPASTQSNAPRHPHGVPSSRKPRRS